MKQTLMTLLMAATALTAAAAERFTAFNSAPDMVRLDVGNLTIITSPSDNRGVHIAAENLAQALLSGPDCRAINTRLIIKPLQPPDNIRGKLMAKNS